MVSRLFAVSCAVMVAATVYVEAPAFANGRFPRAKLFSSFAEKLFSYNKLITNDLKLITIMWHGGCIREQHNNHQHHE